MESLTDRIKKLLTDYNLSPAKFGDEIDVQRSTISHILSGRNKPSLEIVQKIVKRYQEIDLYWLLNGEPNKKSQKTENKTVNQQFTKEESANPSDLPKDDTNVTSTLSLSKKPTLPAIEVISKKEIEKIIIMYSDQTFSVHLPEKN